MRRDLTFALFAVKTDYAFAQFDLTCQFGNGSAFFAHTCQRTSQDNGYAYNDAANTDDHTFATLDCKQTVFQASFANRLCFNFTETCDYVIVVNDTDTNDADSLKRLISRRTFAIYQQSPTEKRTRAK